MVTYVNIAIFLEILIIFKDGSIETKIFRQLYSQYFEFLQSFRIGLIHQKYRTCFLLQKLEFNGINIAECLTDKRRRSSFQVGPWLEIYTMANFRQAANRIPTLQNLNLDFIVQN